MYGIRSYIAVPLYRKGGSLFGTLCALDKDPARLPEDLLENFSLLAKLIALELESEELREERERFVGAVGHDLRQPVHTISLFASAVKASPDLPSSLFDPVDRIDRSTRRLGSMLEDLLDLTRGRLGGGMKLDTRDVDLTGLVQGVLDDLAAVRAGRRVELKIPQDVIVHCDERRMRQLVGNLLTNAFQHGGADHPVVIAATASGAGLVVSVRNDGVPIPPALVGRIFEPFRSGSPDSPGEGLGLGLFIVSEIARAHGWTVDVESDSATGTTFELHLPAA